MAIQYTAATVAAKAFLMPLLFHLLIMVLVWKSVLDAFIYFIQMYTFALLGLWLIFKWQHRRSPFLKAISNRAMFVSSVFSIGLEIARLGWLYADDGANPWPEVAFGLYLITLAVFHFTEFITTALNRPHSVTSEAFLLNHSLEYHLALAISVVEFALESYFVPDWKFRFPFFILAGFLICMTGEAIRKVAMFTAGKNFTHIIADEHNPDHFLVTNGIYAIWRHPSYVGWFYWSIGSQILLGNPISLIGYTVVSWRFFRQRIYYEEMTLANFFGAKYMDYKRAVPTGLPFIDGI